MSARHILAAALFAATSLPLGAEAQHASVTRHFSTCETRPEESTGLSAILDTFQSDVVRRARLGGKLGCEETTSGGAKILRAASALDVPMDVQGAQPDCGFHALRMLMRYYAPTGSIVPGMEFGFDPMRYVAQSMSIGYGGGINGFHMGLIAIHYGFDVTVAANVAGHHDAAPTMDAIRAAVAKGRPAAVLICVDEHGCPVRKSQALGSHWAVVEGFVKGPDGVEYVVAKHPWRGENFLWRADVFEASWKDVESQLVTIEPTSDAKRLGMVQRTHDQFTPSPNHD